MDTVISTLEKYGSAESRGRSIQSSQGLYSPITGQNVDSTVPTYANTQTNYQLVDARNGMFDSSALQSSQREYVRESKPKSREGSHVTSDREGKPPKRVVIKSSRSNSTDRFKRRSRSRSKSGSKTLNQQPPRSRMFTI